MLVAVQGRLVWSVGTAVDYVSMVENVRLNEGGSSR